MAMHSRPRAPRSSGAAHPRHASDRQQPAPIHHHHHSGQPYPEPPRSPSPPSHDGSHDNDNDGAPPLKRRKLSIRSRQTTLDQFAAFSQSAPPPKPPTRVTLASPHGRLLQNLNGVQTELDTNEDELSQPASGATTPKPKRLPQTAVPPAAAPTKTDDKRTLRSQDEGARRKSELSIYFPNYEEIIFDAPREPDFITVDSTLYVTEDSPKPKPDQTTPNKAGKHAKSSPAHPRPASANGIPPPTSPSPRPSTSQFNGSPSLNLDMLARSLPPDPEDPLPDEHFLKSHRRAERKEKQLRNIEKERAMHEKVQLDRILEGLQGHDWLKVLGITGITDGEARKYEPKRDYFITEVQALVNKFKEWREQERRQKLEKDALVAAREEEGEGEEESEGPGSEESSVGPPSSDLNASAARQLQQETAIALKSLAVSKSLKGKEAASISPHKPAVAFAPPPQEEPITSFYDKRHLRDAALGKARHGRNVTAFGHPVPDLGEEEFELPSEYISEDTIRANAREKRRRKRETITNASN